MWFLDGYGIGIDLTSNKSAKKIARLKNAMEYQNVFRLLYAEAWYRIPTPKGLPDTISDKVWKDTIMWYGGIVLLKFGSKHVLGLPGLPTGGVNINGYPAKANVFGRNGFNQEVNLFIPGGIDAKIVRETNITGVASKEADAVFVKAAPIATPIVDYVNEYASKIADSMRTLDIIRANLKRPYVVSAEESVINTVKAFFNSRENNEEFVVSTGVFPADKIKLLPFETTSDSIRDVTMLVEWYCSQFRQIISVSAPSTVDKKAEITTAELNSHKGIETLHNNMRIECMREGIDLANANLGLNLVLPDLEPEEPIKQEVNNDDAGNSNEEVQ